MVSDEEIIKAYKHLALDEGIFCEPASAASLAGLIKYAEDSLEMFSGKQVGVCLRVMD